MTSLEEEGVPNDTHKNAFSFLTVQANVSLQKFELNVPSSDFSCLLVLDNPELKRLTALTELKNLIWSHSDFQTQILNSMEVIVIPPEDEEDDEEEDKVRNKKEEQHEEEGREEQYEEQMQNEQEDEEEEEEEDNDDQQEEKEESDEEDEQHQDQHQQQHFTPQFSAQQLQLRSLGKRPRTQQQQQSPQNHKRPRMTEEERQREHVLLKGMERYTESTTTTNNNTAEDIFTAINSGFQQSYHPEQHQQEQQQQQQEQFQQQSDDKENESCSTRSEEEEEEEGNNEEKEEENEDDDESEYAGDYGDENEHDDDDDYYNNNDNEDNNADKHDEDDDRKQHQEEEEEDHQKLDAERQLEKEQQQHQQQPTTTTTPPSSKAPKLKPVVYAPNEIPRPRLRSNRGCNNGRIGRPPKPKAPVKEQEKKKKPTLLLDRRRKEHRRTPVVSKPAPGYQYEYLTKTIWQPGPLGMKVRRYIDTQAYNLEVPCVTSVLEHSPTHQVGIQIGDIITSMLILPGQEKQKGQEKQQQQGQQQPFNNQNHNVSYETFVANSFQRPLCITIKREVKEKSAENNNNSNNDVTVADTKEQNENNNDDDHNKQKEQVAKMKMTVKDARFVQNILKLKEFYKEHGHYRIPRDEANRSFRKWYDNYTTKGRAHRLNPIPSFQQKYEIINSLENFDWGMEAAEPGQPRSKTFDWKTYDWDTCYELLKQYKAKHGNCYVGVNSKEYPNLGKWCLHLRNHAFVLKKQDRFGKSTILTPERVQKLDALGFPWNVSASLWNDNLDRLKKYKEEHGHCRVPKRYPPDPKLGRWCFAMRMAWKNRCKGIPTKKMTDERFRRLDELGFCWNPKQP